MEPTPASSASHSTSFDEPRRRSLPSPNSANTVHVKPASPEVISSLISSLSAISPEAARHFESMPATSSRSVSTPSSPNALRQTFDLSDPHDAALSPLVRTSRPTTLSPLSATHTLPVADRKSPTSSVRGSNSPTFRDRDDSVSIGSVSIEAGEHRPKSTTGRDSEASDGRKSWKNQMGLMYMSSKERLTEQGNNRKRSTPADSLTLNILDSRGMTMPRGDETLSESSDAHEAHHPRSPRTYNGESGERSPRFRHSGPRSNGTDINGVAVVGGWPIPSRESSLRRTSNSHTSQQRLSYRATHEATNASTPDLQTSHGDHHSPDAVRGHGSANVVEKILHARDADSSPNTSRPGAPLIAMSSSEPPSSMTADAGLQVAQSTQVVEIILKPDEQSAPSPSIVQRKAREDSTRIVSNTSSVSPAPRKPSPATNVTADRTTPPSSDPQRRNSRLMKRSRPSSPKSNDPHRRTLSTAFNRRSEAFAEKKPPRILVEDRPTSADSVEDAIVTYLSAPRLSQKVSHPQTGRVISFSEVGDPAGFAVFCCVGMGLTRYIMGFYDELAATLKLRLITPDRPGVGESEPYPEGDDTPLGWPGQYFAFSLFVPRLTRF